MANYKIEFTDSAAKELKNIDKQFIPRVFNKINSLETEPLLKSTKLVNQPGYRIRIGDYRAVFEINEESKLITIFRIAHRKDIYRKLF